MDELIYILIIVFWIVLSFIGRENKRRKKASSFPGKESPKPESLEDIIGILSGRPVVPVQPEVSMIPEVAPEPVKKVRKPARTPEPFINAEISDYLKSRQAKPGGVEFVETEDVEMHPGYEKMFDLRQAIIYSEILRRPYI